jgi:hypothetical protein
MKLHHRKAIFKAIRWAWFPIYFTMLCIDFVLQGITYVLRCVMNWPNKLEFYLQLRDLRKGKEAEK